MRSLIRRRSAAQRTDPAPSRWAWRMQRLMLTPAFRTGLRVGLPFCATLLGATVYLADDARRAALVQKGADLRASIEQRPEFMVGTLAVDGAQGALADKVRAAVPLELPKSSFDLDLAAIRAQVTDLAGVKSAEVRVRPGGVLQIDVTPRVPAAVWRHAEGLSLIDETGAFVSVAERRADHPTLPLIAGEGADARVPEALALHRTGRALGDRMRGVVRMGSRRWDVVLDRDQRIMLPEEGALPALERVIALEKAQDVLGRDVARVDLRLPRRPTVRMTESATGQWWDIKEETAE